ncbi:MAG: DUF1080 domain-containing protein [Bryobacterales bacterium]|nr:DUF1080 domain-containing protein [Bryobacterales bacterium]
MRQVPNAFTVFAIVTSSLAGQDWKPLFDGKSLGQWSATPFTKAGRVEVANGLIVLQPGGPLTGITYHGEFPRMNYEIRYEAERRRGNDLFATLTFPVGDAFCTWVTGGWGGDIVGLSSLDGADASENETRSYFNFDNNRWYKFRLRVTPERITAWIDDERVVNAEIAGRTVTLRRGEIKLNAPLGFASFATEGALRNVKYRVLSAK